MFFVLHFCFGSNKPLKVVLLFLFFDFEKYFSHFFHKRTKKNICSWHLWFILRILRFEHPSESAEHLLHIRYAEQLCQMELYYLAAIVLMHISDFQRYILSVESILDVKHLLIDPPVITGGKLKKKTYSPFSVFFSLIIIII